MPKKNQGAPACYRQEKTRQRLFITNSGTAPATSIKFSLAAYPITQNGKYLDSNSLKISVGRPSGTVSQSTIAPAKIYKSSSGFYSCVARPSAVVSADFEVNTLALQPGDSLWIDYQMDYLDCGCQQDGSYCYMDNWYHGILNWTDRTWAAQASYTDPCSATYAINQVDTRDYQSWLTTLAETPALVQNNQQQVVRYTVTEASNSWFNSRSRYPNGIYRLRFKLAKGVDYTSFAWNFTNGAVWPAAPSSTTSVDANGVELINLDFRFADSYTNSKRGRSGFLRSILPS